jgi:hypothetical protein
MIDRRFPAVSAVLFALVLPFTIGCGAGHYTQDAYQPASSALKPFTSAGVGVLLEDQRPSAAQDTQGDHILACILAGFLAPTGAHFERYETSTSQALNAYNPAMRTEGSAHVSPADYLRDDLVKEFSASRLLGPAQAVDAPGAAPFTLKAVLKSTALDTQAYCYTPMDTTWLFWMMALPFAGYDFHLVMDLSLYGPDDHKPLWTRTLDAKSGGVTGWYYDTGVTDENSLPKIYGDLLAGEMAKATGELQTVLKGARPDLWRSADNFVAARAARQKAAADGENAVPNPASSGGQPAPWWK